MTKQRATRNASGGKTTTRKTTKKTTGATTATLDGLIVEIKNTGPDPAHLTGVVSGDAVEFAKTTAAKRFVKFSSSPFLASEGPQTLEVPVTKTVQASPANQKSYSYTVVDDNDNPVPKKKSGPPNPPDIVVG